MQRYFLENNNINENTVKITGDDFHHITRVMRMEPGEEIITVNQDGLSAITKINGNYQ